MRRGGEEDVKYIKTGKMTDGRCREKYYSDDKEQDNCSACGYATHTYRQIISGGGLR